MGWPRGGVRVNPKVIHRGGLPRHWAELQRYGRGARGPERALERPVAGEQLRQHVKRDGGALAAGRAGRGQQRLELGAPSHEPDQTAQRRVVVGHVAEGVLVLILLRGKGYRRGSLEGGNALVTSLGRPLGAHGGQQVAAAAPGRRAADTGGEERARRAAPCGAWLALVSAHLACAGGGNVCSS